MIIFDGDSYFYDKTRGVGYIIHRWIMNLNLFRGMPMEPVAWMQHLMEASPRTESR